MHTKTPCTTCKYSIYVFADYYCEAPRLDSFDETTGEPKPYFERVLIARELHRRKFNSSSGVVQEIQFPECPMWKPSILNRIQGFINSWIR